MKRYTVKALGVAALFAGFGFDALALPPAPKVDQMAAEQPKQAGVDVTVLAPADLARCRVEPFPNAQNPAGYILLDGANKPVRRFVAANTPHFNILSFYLDGEEVYRETDSTGKGKVDNFRWLGSNGGKIGRDLDGNGSIDAWDVISPEEVSKEILECVINRDQARMKALMPTEAELKSLGLSPVEIGRVQSKLAAAPQRLAAVVEALKLTNKAKWIHVEFTLPETTAADSFGGAQDIIRHRNGGVMIEVGDGKNVAWMQTGELLKIGNGWRLIEGPAAGQPQPTQKGAATGDEIPESLKGLFAELQGAKDNSGRATVLEKMVAALNGNAQQGQWIRQLIEAYASAAELNEKGAYERLTVWRDQVAKHAPKSPLAGFAEFRALGVEYIVKLKEANSPEKMAAAQKWWRDELEKWVVAYPALEETPEALFRLAMAHEFNGKVGESTAIAHYTTLSKNFPNHPLAAQANGAVNRLTSEGKPLAVVNCNELNGGKPFDSSRLAGKVVVVYFWGSFAVQNGALKADAAFLDGLVKKHGGKLEVVTINLDANPQAAVAAINTVQLPGTHLTSPNRAMPDAWGIMGQHMILVDKTGKVENKNATIPQVADEIEKLLK